MYHRTATTAMALTIGLLLAGAGCSHREMQKTKHGGAGLARQEAAARETDAGRGGQGRGLRQRNRAGGALPSRSWDAATRVRLSDAEREAVSLQSAPASFRPMSSFLEVTGKIYAHQFRKAIVSYPFPARIAAIHIRPGDWVEPGQPLVTLQSEAVGEAKSEYFKALADHELALRNYEREQRLFDRGAGAGKNVQAASAELKVSEASREAAEKKLHVLGFTEDQVREAATTHEINPVITLFAPIAGKVVDNIAALGVMVDQTSEILTILDPRLLCADADIYERDIPRVRKGQKVDVTVPAFPGDVFHGTIQYVGDVLKEETRTITVRTEVENGKQRLKPGMFASLRIILDEQSRALTVPAEAVLDDGEDQIVFVRIGDGYRPTVIIPGSRVNGFLEVLSGLREGDEVVTVGCYQLKSKLYDEILKASGVH
jgi:cobalt-zinc-cadmium efflux system membrane fusion protein